MNRPAGRPRGASLEGTRQTGIWAVLAAVLLLLSGCRSAGFYGQAILGQMDILARGEPLASLIAAPETQETLRYRLSLVLEVRRFAESDLGLPVGRHYLEYVDLERPQAVYCVFAAPEFSLEPKTWCYPFVGCAAYRGYFSEDKARDEARHLAAEGYDVSVGAAAAYSTLGWFADPVLNTFIDRNPEELAGLIFHELAHQILYVADDTTFNESYATAVEQEGVRRWLQKGNPGDGVRYRMTRNRQKDVVALFGRHRRRLAALYASPKPEAVKRRQKAVIFADLNTEYRALLREWGADGGSDARQKQALNNADFVTVGSYHDLVPGFQGLLTECRGDLAVFYRVCKHLSGLPREQRLRLLTTPAKLLEATS